MKINVVYNVEISGYEKLLSILEDRLISHKAEFKSFDISEMEKFGDFTFVIGGDGTLIKTAKFYSKFQIPVMGINLGRLGFLSQAGVQDIDNVVASVLEGHYSVEDRIMLESEHAVALNDFVIKGCVPTRTSKFYLKINDKFVCDYIADGLIISTPTGSTAYGLSAGGPVLNPSLDAFVIVPICPHTLNVRPLVVPSNDVITVNTGDKMLSVASDGGEGVEVSKITVKIADFRAKLAFLNNGGFYSVLKNKLHWGASLTSSG